jgi:hypothetical protein
MKEVQAALLFVASTGLAGCGVLGSGAGGAFEDFAETWGSGRGRDALTWATDAEAQAAIKAFSVNHVTGWTMQAVLTSETTIDSEEDGPGDGEVTLEATQVIGFNPPGVESAMFPTMRAEVAHWAVMRRTGDGWKVAAFEPELVEVREIER